MQTLSEAARTYNMDAANRRLQGARTLTVIPKRSPWGRVDDSTILAPGIVSVSTPSHGGIHLDRRHTTIMRRLFPDCPRLNSRWFEEDVDWSVPFILFCGEVLAYLESQGPSWELSHYAKNLLSARRTWREWIPEAWEHHHSCTLDPSESFVKRQRLARKAVTA